MWPVYLLGGYLDKVMFKEEICLAGQWIRLDAFTAVGLGSIPGQGTKILQAA